jgi:hypothetical protein
LGKTDTDVQQFMDRVQLNHVAVADTDNSSVTPYTQELPCNAREAYLNRISNSIYRDYGAFNPEDVAAGNITATQIKAAYEPLNEVSDRFEYRLIETIHGLLELAGLPIEDPTFTRSQVANQTEITQNVMLAAQYLDDETVIELLPFMTPEQKKRAIEQMRNIERKRNGYGDDGDLADGDGA